MLWQSTEAAIASLFVGTKLKSILNKFTKLPKVKHLFSTFFHVPLPQSTGIETVEPVEAGVVDIGCCVGVEPVGTIKCIIYI